MADEEVATKAPESDAQEKSAIPGDTMVDQGASMGEHCVTDRPAPSGEKPTGEISKIADVDVYITKPADYPHSPSKLLLFLTGGTGIHSINNQLQADKYAAEGFLVVMPDQFNGDPAPNTSTSVAIDPSSTTFIEKVKLGAVEAAKSFRIDMWLARHTPSTVLPVLHRLLSSLNEEFADAIANGGGVYGVGYCFGAKYILLLGSNLDDDVAAGQREHSAESKAEEGMVKKGPAIKVGTLAHGTMVGRDDFKDVKVPMGMVCVEDDALFPDDVREYGVKALKDKGVEVENWVYPGVPHGFAVVGEYKDSKIQEAQTRAFDQMLGFLKSH